MGIHVCGWKRQVIIVFVRNITDIVFKTCLFTVFIVVTKINKGMNRKNGIVVVLTGLLVIIVEIQIIVHKTRNCCVLVEITKGINGKFCQSLVVHCIVLYLVIGITIVLINYFKVLLYLCILWLVRVFFYILFFIYFWIILL